MGTVMQGHGAQGVGAPLVPTERLLGVPAPLCIFRKVGRGLESVWGLSLSFSSTTNRVALHTPLP